jgi:hypothetical protein
LTRLENPGGFGLGLALGGDCAARLVFDRGGHAGQLVDGPPLSSCH